MMETKTTKWMAAMEASSPDMNGQLTIKRLPSMGIVPLRWMVGFLDTVLAREMMANSAMFAPARSTASSRSRRSHRLLQVVLTYPLLPVAILLLESRRACDLPEWIELILCPDS